ncbi:hypothetical protein [Amycolatopsis saalfeldensis]|uniref:Uncharacterized protein n=1 Tax=Amycolatopsis saalfeldensis TaxID=394193 RepID=A0A1H8YN40_9PSEU|nr:hypothetical protein [Amycolatopsis saalfeldensis]SEP53600.1 hypothetical protein SAMN04489732_12925 [Amycolatopsis saalfeldensis]
MTDQAQTIPSDWQVQINDLGTPDAAWVLVREHEGIGPVAEGALAVTVAGPGGAVPDDVVARWVADCLEVAGVTLVPAGPPQAWAVEINF